MVFLISPLGRLDRGVQWPRAIMLLSGGSGLGVVDPSVKDLSAEGEESEDAGMG